MSQWPTERLVSALYRWLFHRHYICQDYVSLGDSTDGHWDMCIVEPYRPQPPCLVYSFGYHRCSFRPHRRHCKQWRTNALMGTDTTVTWGPSIPSAGPQGLKLEARSAESGGEALRRKGLLPGLGSGVSHQCQGFWLGGPQELGVPVHWTAWTPGFYATDCKHC